MKQHTCPLSNYKATVLSRNLKFSIPSNASQQNVVSVLMRPLAKCGEEACALPSNSPFLNGYLKLSTRDDAHLRGSLLDAAHGALLALEGGKEQHDDSFLGFSVISALPINHEAPDRQSNRSGSGGIDICLSVEGGSLRGLGRLIVNELELSKPTNMVTT